MTDAEPKVFLVGAGPGNPGLLTLRAVECLSRADLIVYDQLAAAPLLEHTRAGAECVCVSELGPYAERRPLIHRAMIDAARRGKVVVRLKGGDPFVFGRGGEEAEALRAAGISFEIVPGVTAGLGAAAFAGIPLTHRAYSSAVAFVTGHEDPAKETPAIDWEALARFPGTLVFYMGVARLGGIATALIEKGKTPDTPAALVHWATTSRQRTLVSTLGQLAEAARAAQFTAPSLVIIGPVVALREQVQWFERRPLFGKGVLVTRPRHQAGELMWRLDELRWNVAGSPTLPADVKIRLMAHVKNRITSEGELILTSQRYRDQGRNRDDCLEKLRALILRAVTPPRPRKATRPSRASRFQRLQAKKHRSAMKKSRGRPQVD